MPIWAWKRGCLPIEKNPFTCSEYVDYPRSCLPSTGTCCGGGGGGRLLHMQSIWLFHTDELLFTQTAFYPVTRLQMKRTAVTRTAYYPVTVVRVHNFLFMCTMLILISQHIYSTLTHRAGVVGKFFFKSVESTLTETCQNCLLVQGFFPSIFAVFLCSKFLADLSSYSLHI